MVMHRSGSLAVATALLLVLAGCMGGPTDTSTPTTETTTEAPTTSTQTSHTTTPASTTTTNPNRIAPGLAKDGVENGTRVLQAHEQALLNAGSFTTHIQLNSSRPAGVSTPDTWRPNQSMDGQFNRATSRWYLEQLVWGPDQRRISTAGDEFLTNNTTYTREGTPPPNGSWGYSTEQTSLTPQEFQQQMARYSGSGQLRAALWEFNFTYAGTVDHNGATLHQFNSTAFVGESEGTIPETVTNATATFLVDERGIVHYLKISQKGTMSAPEDVGRINVTSTTQVTVEEIGTTTITRPSWIEMINSTAT